MSCGIIIKGRPYFSRQTLTTLYYSFAHSHITLYISCWNNTYKRPATAGHTIQNQALGIIESTLHLVQAEPLLTNHCIWTVVKSAGIACISFSWAINRLRTQVIFLSSFLSNPNVTRFSANGNLTLPKIRTNYGRQTAHLLATTNWKALLE